MCWTYGELPTTYYYIWGQTYNRLSAMQVNVNLSYFRGTVLSFFSEKAMDLLDSPADSSIGHHCQTITLKSGQLLQSH